MAKRAILIVILTLGGVIARAEPELVWDDLFDGNAYTDIGTAAIADPDGHLVVGGESWGLSNRADMLIRKLDRETGDQIWSRRYGSGGENDMALTELLLAGDGEVIVGGYIRGCVG